MENLFEIDSFVADEKPENFFESIDDNSDEKKEEQEKPEEETEDEDNTSDDEFETEDEKDDVEEDDEEDEEDEEEEQDVSSVKAFYNVAKDFLPLEENESPDEDFIRSQLESMPERMFMEYVDAQPEWFKDMLIYQNNVQDKSPEGLKQFFERFVKEKAFSETDLLSEEGARKFLKNSELMKKLYDSEDEINEALDILSDKNRLIPKAKELNEKLKAQREKEKEQELKRVEEEKVQRLENERKFFNDLQKEIDNLGWKEEQKQKVIRELNSNVISEKWKNIHTNPKHFAQFGNLFSYFDSETGFDKLYEILENKKKSSNAKQTKETIEKDSLGKLFKSGKSRNLKKSDDIDFFVS